VTGVLYAIGRFSVKRRPFVLGAWLIIAIGLVAVSHQFSINTNNNVSLPGTNSQKATDVLAGPFPEASYGSSPIVIHAKSGKLTDSQYATAVNNAAADVAKAPEVASVINPLTTQGASTLSKDQSTGYLSVFTKVNPNSLSEAQAQTIIDAADPAVKAGLEVQTGGALGQKVSTPSTESSELIGIIAAMIILAFTFGTIVAMLVPILTAIFALATTLAIIRMLGHVTDVPTVAPTLATMIGLGVGIDYALFIVTRHFRGMRDGLDIDESIARSVATSGGAVFFAGATVTIALASLAVAGIPLVTTMGLMAAIAVVVAVSAALTLLPAILGFLGPHIQSLRIRNRHPESSKADGGLWAKWAHEIASHPLIAGLAALAILIPLMIPVLSLELGQQDTAALSTSTTARQAYDLITEYFGEGVNGPLLVAVTLGTPAQAPSGSSSSSSSGSSSGSSGSSSSSSSSSSDSRDQDPRLQTLQNDVKQTKNVVGISPTTIDNAGTTAYFSAISSAGPADQTTTNLVNTLRNTTIPSAEKGTNMKAYVGGQTASYIDLATVIGNKLPLQIAVVIVLAFILLTLAFRTVVVPAQAAVMNLLSITASYGVLTAIFQFGWGIGVLGHSDPVPIVSYVPLFMFAILFGLLMDYEVFLVSQIEEHVHEGEDNKGSVVGGLVTSARVITAAASIMVFVFGSFILNGNPTVQQFGIGLAVAVILDATVVRCLLVPALMILMGKVNWYMPGWLDKVTPHISIEGQEFFDARDKEQAQGLVPEREPAGATSD
jgi:putative drug exporter of the RND superfamily